MTRTSLDTDCPSCAGHGRLPPVWNLCRACDGLGYGYRAGAPAFGHSLTLAKIRIGQVVTLGTGQVGRVVHHGTAGWRPITHVRLWDPFTDAEDLIATPFPTACGVAFAVPGDWQTRTAPTVGGSRAAADVLDPMRTRP